VKVLFVLIGVVLLLYFVLVPIVRNFSHKNQPEVVSINLRTTKSVAINPGDIPDRYFVVFNAKGGSITGHAYVTWGQESSQARASVQYCYGIVPDGQNPKSIVLGNVKAIFRSTDCWVPGKWNSLIVEVDPDVFDKTFGVYSRWKHTSMSSAQNKIQDVFSHGQSRFDNTGEFYKLLSRDCLAFIIEVAERIPGLRLPKRGVKFPVDYVKSLIAQNGN
jgi:hypothetical protein